MPAIRYFKISFVQVYNFFVVLNSYDKREEKYTAELNEALQQYDEYKEQAQGFYVGEFGKARLDIRSDKERNALNQISNSYGAHFSRSTFFSSVRDTDMKLDDDIDMRAVREYAYQQRRKHKNRKAKSHTSRRDRKEYKSAGMVLSTLLADL